MDLGRLGKKIRNELLRNPKKSAILAVIGLVALYFWFPLIRGWVGGPVKKAASQTVKQTVKQTISPASPVPTAAREPSAAQVALEPALRWDELVRRQGRDPLMSPATLGATTRNPFQWSDEVRQALQAVKQEQEAAIRPKFTSEAATSQTPGQLGLTLMGTMIGPRARVATISGRTYTEGSTVATGDSTGEDAPAESASSVQFKLTEVKQNHVVLTRGEQRYTLEFHRAELPAGDEIVLGKRP